MTQKIIEEAYGYSSERINDAQGQSSRFLDILAEYKNSPDVTRKRMYLETMRQVLPNVDMIYVIDQDQQSPLPLLNLSGNKGLSNVPLSK